jgi:hypothetical protein
LRSRSSRLAARAWRNTSTRKRLPRFSAPPLPPRTAPSRRRS